MQGDQSDTRSMSLSISLIRHADSPPIFPIAHPEHLVVTRTHGMTTRSQNNIFKHKVHLSTKHPTDTEVAPTLVSQALKDSRYRNAMAEEFTTLAKHGTWDLVYPPPQCNVIGCK